MRRPSGPGTIAAVPPRQSDAPRERDPEAIEDATATFQSVRGRLFGIAYRMLGTAADAEDIVQETWVRWQTTDRTAVRTAPAFLATTATRLAINAATTARARREHYVGPWLPEPVSTTDDPMLGAERGEALELAVLMLLERLTPRERAAYILRQAFDYSYREIADIVQVSELNARQLVSRARHNIASERREPVEPAEHRRLLDAFVRAAKHGDLVALERLFSESVVSMSDGGGVVRASKFPVVGRQTVAKYLRAFAPRFWPDVTVDVTEANSRPAAVLSRDGDAFALLTIDASAEGIDRIFWVMNPAKLEAITR